MPERPKRPDRPGRPEPQQTPKQPAPKGDPGGPQQPGPRDPGGPDQPWPGGGIPDDVLAGLPFRALDPELPLLLLPVRLETRYRLQADPPELRIRIYPDQVHIDTGPPDPGTVETDLARQFWRRWLAGPGEAARHAAWHRLAAQVGPQRAAWLARESRPVIRPDGTPRFPPAGDGSAGSSGPQTPARPVLLPKQWLTVGYGPEGPLFTAVSKPVTAGLRTGHDPSVAPVEIGATGLVTDPGLAWMIDYDQAVAAGMAITVPLVGPAANTSRGIDVLLVVGVDASIGALEAAGELERLLGVHARAEGLAFVPQGTPTNNTATVQAGWSATNPGPAGNPSTTDSTADAGQEAKRPGRPAKEPSTSPGQGPLWLPGLDPDPIGAPGDNAERLAQALGLARSATLRQVPHGSDDERERSRAMLQVCYETVLGTFTRRLLHVGNEPGLAAATVDALRSWCLSWVTGGAPLPSLAVGPQPYGVLPVRRSTPPANPASTAEHVEATVLLLLDQWRAAAASLPRMDPSRTDRGPRHQGGQSRSQNGEEGGDEAAIAAILATQPHPARLFTRRLDEYATADWLTRQVTPQAFWAFCMGLLDPAMHQPWESPWIEINALYGLRVLHDPPGSIAAQLGAWQDVESELSSFLRAQGHAGLIEQAAAFVGDLISVLEGWQARQDPIELLDLDSFNGILGEVDTTLVEGVLWATATEWDANQLVEAGDAGPEQRAASYLPDLANRLRARSAGLPASTIDFGGREPLLHQLLDATLGQIPDWAADEAAAVAALELLAGRDADELAWLLRESLGLGTHRLDAWATSLAAERLERLRASRPAGIQVGAFGWVTDLAPRGRAVASAGFVHAPSMAQAATAAVLRAGWLARDADGAQDPAAVDLRSDRVRTASWLLEGVSRAQDLGDLLGSRFERFLHDAGADRFVRSVRERVLATTGRAGEPPDAPVDGVDLLEASREKRLGVVDEPVRAALADLEAAFDAVNDAGLFEAVHQLTAGNLERATAMLDALATGTATGPQLLGSRIPRAWVPIEHRVLILLDESTGHPGRGWAPGGERDLLAPALAAWVASLLPVAAEVGFTAMPLAAETDGQPGSAQAMTLAALGLGALDALALAGGDPETVTAALATLVGGVAGVSVAVDPAAPGPARVSLAEFAVLAIELRRAVDRLRVADARDLRPANTPGEPDSDDRRALDGAEALVLAYDRLVDDLDDAIQTGAPQAVAPVAERFARLGMATGRPPGDLAAAPELLAMAARRLSRIASVRVDPGDRRPGLEERLAALLGGRVPLLASFQLDEGAVDLTVGQAGSDEIDDWLDAAGRVRPDLGRLVEAGLLSELLDPGAGLRAAAGQDPPAEGEGWAAISRPAGRGGRLSVVAVTAPGGPPGPGATVSGLVVDRWPEALPRAEQTTGVTFQFDAPSTRPPQSWLLAVTPEGEGWSLDLVLATLLETLEWSGLRAVGPEDLLAYGRAVPTAFAPGWFSAWPGQTTTEDG